MANYHLKRFDPAIAVYPEWLRSIDPSSHSPALPMGKLERHTKAKLAVADQGQAVVLSVWVVAGSAHSRIVGVFQHALKCHIAAGPAQQQVNNLLLQLLSKLLHIPVAQMAIVTGGTSRKKQVRIGGIAPQRVLYLLKPFVA